MIYLLVLEINIRLQLALFPMEYLNMLPSQCFVICYICCMCIPEPWSLCACSNNTIDTLSLYQAPVVNRMGAIIVRTCLPSLLLLCAGVLSGHSLTGMSGWCRLRLDLYVTTQCNHPMVVQHCQDSFEVTTYIEQEYSSNMIYRVSV